MFDLNKKNALITGASGGIGGAIAKIFHSAGANVALTGTRSGPLEELTSELGDHAHILLCNLGDRAAVDALPKQAKMVEAFGMRLSVIERKLPHLKIIHGLEGRDAQIEDIKTLLRNMAEVGMDVLCYNWMPDEDWQRTSKDLPERGGAKVTAFDLKQAGEGNLTDADGLPSTRTPADRLWENLKRFLDEIFHAASNY